MTYCGDMGPSEPISRTVLRDLCCLRFAPMRCTTPCQPLPFVMAATSTPAPASSTSPTRTDRPSISERYSNFEGASPPSTADSKTYGLFCSRPAALGETARTATTSSTPPSDSLALSRGAPLSPPPPSPGSGRTATPRGRCFENSFGTSSAYTSKAAWRPAPSLRYPLIPSTNTGGVAITVAAVTSCLPALGVCSLSSIVTSCTQPALNPAWASRRGLAAPFLPPSRPASAAAPPPRVEADAGHPRIRASMLFARLRG